MDFQTFLSVLLGIPAGFFLDRWLKHYQSIGDKKQLANALKDAIRENLELIDELSKIRDVVSDIKIGSIPKLMDLTLLDATAVRKYDILNSIKACRLVDKARYILSDINNRQNLIKMMASNSTNEETRNIMTNIHNRCLTLIKTGWIIKPLQDAYKELDNISKQNILKDIILWD